jgi:acyl carrier protein
MISISSRTPEGNPGRCPLCGAQLAVAFAAPAGDAVCPQCGCLLWEADQQWQALRNRISAAWSVSPELITPEMEVVKLLGKPVAAVDSLDVVELVMLLEEESDLDLSAAEVAKLHTVRDIFRLVLQRMHDRRAAKPDSSGDA